MRRRAFLRAGVAVGAASGGLLEAACAPALQSRPAGPVQRPLRLASNENPLGLCPAARQAVMTAIAEGNRYPRQARQALIEAIAAQHGVSADHVMLGTGSTEILQIAVQAMPPEAPVVVADPTYEDVPQYATAAGRRMERVPLRADWSHDIGRMREVVAGAGGAALVFICNPNNPTGTLTPCGDVEAWLREADARTTLVVDEAYFEFAEDPGYRTMQPFALSRPNVVLVRTFSKIHAMAGMRLGYAIAQPATIRRLRTWACNNNGNTLALAAARASLDDAAFHERSLASNRAARRILTECLGELGLEHLPSHTNFVMHRLPGEVADYNARMRERGVLVGRPFPPLTTMSRVSIGLPAEMAEFAQELRDFRARGWA